MINGYYVLLGVLVAGNKVTINKRRAHQEVVNGPNVIVVLVVVTG